ncbi:hypothetical protein LUZ62_027793 [Rhynchospora pubera]|uniref:S-protein homolog n=1 Tax=Rhynchospora pubera TaxID=906938 RepID=A0AAV8HC61_9POAL|nr:hypothetical protein LUZ62_027793 [Rhynchospora pubera]
MAATRIQRIIYTTVGATIIVIISSLYRYEPDISEDKYESDGYKAELMNIAVWNENPEGSGASVELHCHGYIGKNTSVAEWSTNAVFLQPTNTSVLHLPKLGDSAVVHVFCKYQGGNGCQAEFFEVFVHPGNDIYYCSESVNTCSIVFQAGGSVEKRYDDREYFFLGYVPSPEKVKKCSWIECLLDPQSQLIGNKSYCGATSLSSGPGETVEALPSLFHSLFFSDPKRTRRRRRRKLIQG